ncbi:hypothetical protein [Paenarthrobacter nitroguajacolicus]|uniref:hypothetical protein n=1 Tax=Paenarthrobacter nitroguajacolicus TaxID=211146 RepID=UPI001FB8B550|nr:hypothetical protein [Paenarthrobacter nitroguajacolicus]
MEGHDNSNFHVEVTWATENTSLLGVGLLRQRSMRPNGIVMAEDQCSALPVAQPPSNVCATIYDDSFPFGAEDPFTYGQHFVCATSDGVLISGRGLRLNESSNVLEHRGGKRSEMGKRFCGHA